MYYTHERQKFLANQGYAYKIIRDLEKEYTEEFLRSCELSGKEKQREYLRTISLVICVGEVMQANVKEDQESDMDDDDLSDEDVAM